jgi:hypothetical protein
MRKRRWLLALILTFVLWFIVAVIIALLSSSDGPPDKVEMLYGYAIFGVSVLLLLPMIVLGWILFLWRCPNCNRIFNLRRTAFQAMWPPSMYGTKCSRCGTDIATRGKNAGRGADDSS